MSRCMANRTELKFLKSLILSLLLLSVICVLCFALLLLVLILWDGTAMTRWYLTGSCVMLLMLVPFFILLVDGRHGGHIERGFEESLHC